MALKGDLDIHFAVLKIIDPVTDQILITMNYDQSFPDRYSGLEWEAGMQRLFPKVKIKVDLWPQFTLDEIKKLLTKYSK